MAAELLEHLARLEAVHAHHAVERPAQHVRAIFGQRHARDALVVRAVKAAQALAAADLPHLDLAVLRPAHQQLVVAAEVEAQHRLLMHHKHLLRLVRKVLLQPTGRAVPHLDEAVHAAGHQHLPVWREPRTLGVRLGRKLDLVLGRGGVHLHLVTLALRLAAEQVKRDARREQSLALLPFECLANECQEAAGRHHRHLLAERVRDSSTALLLGAPAIDLARVKVGSAQQVLQPRHTLRILLPHALEDLRLAQHRARCVHLLELHHLHDHLLV
mmetsp:Transcript_37/g.89  ORF Transcript_37/g.89 Transcript_37/m.89 type:complete len:272 (-) Transcript_37:303-1118(-)